MDMMFLPPGMTDQERAQQVRVYALSMAGRDYPGTGRHDGVLVLAKQYENWIVGTGEATAMPTKPSVAHAQHEPQVPGQSPTPPPAPAANPGGDDGARDSSHDIGGVRDGGGGAPASVRQAARRT